MNIDDSKQLYGLISKSIIEALKRADVDDEDIFLFSVSLEIAVIKAYAPSVTRARLLTRALLKDNGMEKDEYIGTLFQENRAALMRIYKRVWLDPFHVPENIGSWERKCRKLFRKDASINECIAVFRILMDSFTMDIKKFYISIALIDRLLHHTPERKIKKNGRGKSHGNFDPGY
jgi:hypothetical protein